MDFSHESYLPEAGIGNCGQKMLRPQTIGGCRRGLSAATISRHALCLSKVRVCLRPKKTQPARKPACRIKSPLYSYPRLLEGLLELPANFWPTAWIPGHCGPETPSRTTDCRPLFQRPFSFSLPMSVPSRQVGAAQLVNLDSRARPPILPWRTRSVYKSCTWSGFTLAACRLEDRGCLDLIFLPSRLDLIFLSWSSRLRILIDLP